MEGPSVPMSTDVVFVMEAKECNQYMRDRRMVHTFASILSKELKSAGLEKNRYKYTGIILEGVVMKNAVTGMGM